MKKFLVQVLLIQIAFASLGVAQSPNALSARKVQDYFQDVESKSYYQQERIRSMKGEMNEYSERLHSLQEKFHKIFYGRSSESLHQSPFNDQEKISYPSRKYRDPVPVLDAENMVRRPSMRTEQKNKSNQLAFTVEDSKPSIAQEELNSGNFASNQPLASANPSGFHSGDDNRKDASVEFSNSSHFGGYLILRPGVAIPYKGQKTYNGLNKIKHREYKPGLSLMMSAGYRWNEWKLGGGLFYRENAHDTGSFEKNGLFKESFKDGSQSSSVGGFVEAAYTHYLKDAFGVYGSVAVGYGVSRIEDYGASSSYNRTRMEPFLFVSSGFGLSWIPSQYFEASLGYRYLHEKEVPAHAIEIALEGKF